MPKSVFTFNSEPLGVAPTDLGIVPLRCWLVTPPSLSWGRQNPCGEFPVSLLKHKLQMSFCPELYCVKNDCAACPGLPAPGAAEAGASRDMREEEEADNMMKGPAGHHLSPFHRVSPRIINDEASRKVSRHLIPLYGQRNRSCREETNCSRLQGTDGAFWLLTRILQLFHHVVLPS